MKKSIILFAFLFTAVTLFPQKKVVSDTTKKNVKEKQSQEVRYSVGASGVKRSISYKFDAAITDSDPGNGIFRYDNPKISEVKYIIVDKIDLSGEDQTKWYSTWDDTTGATGRGSLNIVEFEGSNVNYFNITGVFEEEDGYWKFPVEYISGAIPANGKIYYYVFNRIAHKKPKVEKEEQAVPPVAEVKPEEQPQPVPEVTPVQQPQPVQEVKPEPQPQPVQEAKPEPQPQPIPEVKPEPRPQPVPEAKPEPQPQPVQEVKPEPQQQPQPVQQPRQKKEQTPAQTTKPARTGQQAQQPKQTTQPVQTARPTHTAQATQPAKPAQTTQPAQTSKPAQATQPAQPAQPTQPSPPSRPVQTQQPVQNTQRVAEPENNPVSQVTKPVVVPNVFTAAGTTTHRRCYRGIIEAGYGPGLGEYGIDNFRFNFINAIRFGKRASIGLGIGYRRYFEDEKITDWKLYSNKNQVPVFVDLRTTFRKKKITPYIALQLGGAAALDSAGTKQAGLYFSPSGGLWFNISDRFAIFGGVAYEVQKLEYILTSDNSHFRKNAGSVSLNIGFSF